MEIRVDVHVHSASADGPDLTHALEQIYLTLETIMTTLDQVLTEVTDENSRLDSIDTLITGLQQQVADALSGVTVPPAVQSKIDAVFNGLQANKVKIDAALNTNVPPAP